MLWQRVVTALVLLLVLLPALFYPSAVPFAGLAMVFIAAGAWEWARLVGYGPRSSLVCGLVCALACVLAWTGGLLTYSLTWLWFIATLVWVLGGAWLLHGGVPAWSALPRALRMAIGFACRQAQAGAWHQPWQKLGRRLGRHGWRDAAGGSVALGRRIVSGRHTEPVQSSV